MSQQTTTAVIDASKANSSVFDLWAQVYDSQLNPLLMLEERETASLLPVLDDLDVLDIGCGTGRWLSRLENCGAASLTGIDSSSAMLRCARQKLTNATLLYQNLSSNLSIDDSKRSRPILVCT